MKRTLLLTAFALSLGTSFAQKKTTTSAVVNFDATTSLDKLPKAENKSAIAVLNTQSGAVKFEATMKNFQFGNPMIQEHFNSAGWLDSDQFPTAVFDGKITNLSDINFEKEGTYTANVEGDLTIHGKTNKVTTKATITVAGKSIKTASEFKIQLADFDVKGRAIEAGKVAKEPVITVSADF